MERDTNEKSLMVVQDNFLTKVKNFFSRFFFGRDEEIEDEEVIEEVKDNSTEVIKEEPEQKERKLYNFDADNPDEWPEPKEIVNEQEDDDVNYDEEPVSESCREKE